MTVALRAVLTAVGLVVVKVALSDAQVVVWKEPSMAAHWVALWVAWMDVLLDDELELSLVVVMAAQKVAS